ncbi:MAG: hypothetical protein PHD73_01775 [Sediminibacterium sp.]|nr:hypothetical protein [Sediminibacterium sp.]
MYMYLQRLFISRFLLPVLLTGACNTVFSQSSFDGHLLIADSMPHKTTPGFKKQAGEILGFLLNPMNGTIVLAAVREYPFSRIATRYTIQL